MAEATTKNKQKSWKLKLRGGTANNTPSELFDAMIKFSKEKLTQKLDIDEGLVDPSRYLDLFSMATKVISAKTDYFSSVKMITEGEEQENKPPCNLSKERESNCKLDQSKFFINRMFRGRIWEIFGYF